MASTATFLKTQRYGKDRVRLVKVIRENDPWQEVVELMVRILLEGDFESSYTKADNSRVVATDSMKNTIYVLAKQSSNVQHPELFAQELGRHFLDTYGHVSAANVHIIQHRWARTLVDGKPHVHSFHRDSEEIRTVEAHISRTKVRDTYDLALAGGISGLWVLKTTGSSFTNFVRDRFTTLPDADDRILSTSVDATWRFAPATLTTTKKLHQLDYDFVHKTARDITLRVFATDNSASVQATLYTMAKLIIEQFAEIQEVSYSLPNKHVFTVDLKPFGLKNTGKDATIFMPFNDPSGLITATVSRSGTAAKL